MSDVGYGEWVEEGLDPNGGYLALLSASQL